ncbi:hypothetical protein [Actinoplanes sp. DH11]|uniref:hypothetical protein n=1 Tax=Actinoplanes sp. DH11 TaxID=2857011 RepID=UPI001E629695|nr:hypothetical protein [Actinoplanes sp. DH11]
MSSDFHADTEDLRRHAAAADALAARLSGLDGQVPDVAPRWAAAAAATLAADAAVQQLAVLGHDVAVTAERIRVAADAYREADARAAVRFRLAG